MTDAPQPAWQATAAPLSVGSGVLGAWLLARGNFAAGGALVLLSVLALRWPASIWSAEPVTTLTARQHRLLLLAVFLVGVFFRTYRMLPPGLWGDDALNGLLAFDILDGKVRSPFEIVIHSYSHFHALSNYLIAASFALFGPDLWTLRLPGVVLGSLEVPLVYATAAPLFGAPTALLAALFFATSPLEIAHDKSLIQLVFGQFLLLIGVCLLVRGLHGRRHWLVPLAGLPIALSLCTYHSAKLAPLIALTFLARSLLPGENRVRPRDAAAFTVVFLLASIPAVASYVLHPGTLSARIGGVSLWPVLAGGGSLAPLWDSFWRTLMIFHYQQGPEYHWFGLGFDPAFNVVIGFLVLHGLAESVVHWKEPRHFLLLAWAAIGLLPGILSTEAPRAYRVLLATSPLYMWAALPVVRLAAVTAASEARRVSRVLALLLVAAVPLVDFNIYFYRVYTHPLYRHFQGERLVDIARTLRSHGSGWTGYLLTEQFAAGHESLAFLSRAWGITIRDVASLSEVMPVAEMPEKGLLFVMTGAGLAAGDALRAFHPGTEIVRHMPLPARSSWFDRAEPKAGVEQIPTAAFLPVPRAVLEQVRAANAAPVGLGATYDLPGRRLTRVEPYPYYAFFPPTFAGPFSAELQGTIHVPEPGGYRLRVECNGPVEVDVDDVRLTPEAVLAGGSHGFRLQVSTVVDRLRLAIYWQRADERPELVPIAAWRPTEQGKEE